MCEVWRRSSWHVLLEIIRGPAKCSESGLDPGGPGVGDSHCQVQAGAQQGTPHLSGDTWCWPHWECDILRVARCQEAQELVIATTSWGSTENSSPLRGHTPSTGCWKFKSPHWSVENSPFLRVVAS